MSWECSSLRGQEGSCLKPQNKKISRRYTVGSSCILSFVPEQNSDANAHGNANPIGPSAVSIPKKYTKLRGVQETIDISTIHEDCIHTFGL